MMLQEIGTFLAAHNARLEVSHAKGVYCVSICKDDYVTSSLSASIEGALARTMEDFRSDMESL